MARTIKIIPFEALMMKARRRMEWGAQSCWLASDNAEAECVPLCDSSI